MNLGELNSKLVLEDKELSEMISRLEIQKARSKWVEKALENKDKLEKALPRGLSQLFRQEREAGDGGELWSQSATCAN